MDGIAPRFLNELRSEARRNMLRNFNQSWMEGFLPQAWKYVVIIPILKPGKPAGRRVYTGLYHVIDLVPLQGVWEDGY